MTQPRQFSRPPSRHAKWFMPVIMMFAVFTLFPAPARSDSVDSLPLQPYGVSSDGSVVVGFIRTGGNDQAHYWTGGVLTPLGFLDTTGTYFKSDAKAVSADGSVVVGYSQNNSGYSEAFRWTGGTMTGLGFLDDTIATPSSHAQAVSADGSVVAGWSDNSSDNMEAFRWVSDGTPTGGTMTGLGILAGYDFSEAQGISSDGSVVVGVATTHGYTTSEAFRWVSDGTPTGGTLTGLGFLDTTGTYFKSDAYATSSDGSVVVGSSHNNNDKLEAFRWTGGTMTGLGFMDATYQQSRATAVSADGSVVVGSSLNSSNDDIAFRWTAETGMVSLTTLLENAGVDMTGHTLANVDGISADGTIIVGHDDGYTGTNYIARITSVGPSGMISVDQLNQSLATMGMVGPVVSGMGQLSMSRLGSVTGGQGMHFSVTNSGTETAGSDTLRGLSSDDEMQGHLDLWMVGSVGTNIEINGDDLGLHGGLGMTWDNGGEWRFGGGVFGDTRDLDTSYGGDQSIRAIGPGVFAVYTPEGTGFEFRVSALWQSVNLDLTRGYANGAGSASSEGSTDADVFGLSGRVQWTESVTDHLYLTPFAEYTWQDTQIDGYAESGGPFPASFDSRSETSNSIRTGLRADVNLFDEVGTWAWLAWDHRFEDTSSGMGGTATGMGAFAYPGAKLDQDWAEAGLGASWDITERLSASSSLGVAIGCDDDSASDLTATFGFNYRLW
ncbi:MAG: autotransporter domain-containing protein [Desulfovibrionaceae bacterium]